MCFFTINILKRDEQILPRHFHPTSNSDEVLKYLILQFRLMAILFNKYFNLENLLVASLRLICKCNPNSFPSASCIFRNKRWIWNQNAEKRVCYGKQCNRLTSFLCSLGLRKSMLEYYYKHFTTFNIPKRTHPSAKTSLFTLHKRWFSNTPLHMHHIHLTCGLRWWCQHNYKYHAWGGVIKLLPLKLYS